MLEIEKYKNHIYNLEEIKLSSENELKQNYFFIKNCFIPNIAEDRLTVLYNSLIHRGLVVPCNKIYTYKPEYFVIDMVDIDFAKLTSQNTYMQQYIVALVDFYVGSSIPSTDIRMRWVINTLIHYEILKNVFDPMNKQAETFKELFDYEDSSNR